MNASLIGSVFGGSGALSGLLAAEEEAEEEAAAASLRSASYGRANYGGLTYGGSSGNPALTFSNTTLDYGSRYAALNAPLSPLQLVQQNLSLPITMPYNPLGSAGSLATSVTDTSSYNVGQVATRYSGYLGSHNAASPAIAWGAGEGVVQGVVNILSGIGNSAKEFAYMTADVMNSTHELASGISGYRGNLSSTANALESGDLGLKQYYGEFAANTVTLGTYGQGKALYQLGTGQITVDEASAQIGSTAVFQLAGAAATKMPRSAPSTYSWPGAKILSGEAQVGLKNPALVDSIKADMKAGAFRYTAPEGRISGWYDRGTYYLSEGHHRVNAALELFEESGDASYLSSLLENGKWEYSPPDNPIGALPRR